MNALSLKTNQEVPAGMRWKTWEYLVERDSPSGCARVRRGACEHGAVFAPDAGPHNELAGDKHQDAAAGGGLRVQAGGLRARGEGGGEKPCAHVARLALAVGQRAQLLHDALRALHAVAERARETAPAARRACILAPSKESMLCGWYSEARLARVAGASNVA